MDRFITGSVQLTNGALVHAGGTPCVHCKQVPKHIVWYVAGVGGKMEWEHCE